MVQALLRRNNLRVFCYLACIIKRIIFDTLEELGCVHSLAIWIIAWHWNGERDLVTDRNLGRKLLINTVWVLLACLYHMSMRLPFCVRIALLLSADVLLDEVLRDKFNRSLVRWSFVF